MKALLQSIITGQEGVGTLRLRLMRGVFYSLIGSVFAQGMGFVATIVTARILGSSAYGVFGLVTTTVTTVATFAGMGLGLTLTRHLAALRSEQPQRAGTQLGLGLLVALLSGSLYAAVLFFMAEPLAQWVLHAPPLADYLRVAALQLLFAAVSGVLLGALAGLESFRSAAIGNSVKALINVVALPGAALLWGVKGAVIGATVATACAVVIDLLVLRRALQRWGIRLRLHGVWAEAGILRDFTLPTFLASAMIGPGIWVASAILVNQPQGYAALGVFTVALSFQRLLLVAAAIVDAAVLPLLCSHEGGNSDRLQRFNVLFSWILASVLAVPLLALPEVIGWVGGAEYGGERARQTLALVVLFTCVQIYKQGLTRALVAEGRMWWAFLSGLQWALVLMGATWVLSGVGWGAVGLAAAYTLTWVINLVIFVPLYQRLRLIPLNTVISREAVMVWLVLSILAGVVFFDVSMAVRLTLAGVAVVVLYLQFQRLMNASKKPHELLSV